jgi:hypothetical protein
MYASKARAYLSVVPFSCSTLTQLLALPTNSRLGWKSLRGTETLACDKNWLIKVKKCFIILAPGWALHEAPP